MTRHVQGHFSRLSWMPRAILTHGLFFCLFFYLIDKLNSLVHFIIKWQFGIEVIYCRQKSLLGLLPSVCSQPAARAHDKKKKVPIYLSEYRITNLEVMFYVIMQNNHFLCKLYFKSRIGLDKQILAYVSNFPYIQLHFYPDLKSRIGLDTQSWLMAIKQVHYLRTSTPKFA